MFGPDEAMPNSKVDDHQIDVELELICFINELYGPTGWPFNKAADLTIGIPRLEPRWQFEIVDE